MNPALIAEMVLALMTGKPWNPPGYPNVTITVPQNMKFEVRGAATDRVVITWQPPQVHIRAGISWLGVNGSLTGLILTPGKLQALISGPIPDVTIDLNTL